MTTLKELRDLIQDLPDEWLVRGYEGEGGSWVIIEELPNHQGKSYELNTNSRREVIA